jgi:hypothetical protein
VRDHRPQLQAERHQLPALDVDTQMTHPRDSSAASRADASGDPAALLDVAERFRDLAERRVGLPAASGAAAIRARQLRDHLETYVLPRARDIDAPLLVVLLGPTGAGKSSLFNAIAGREVSTAGVLRPTTREIVTLVHPGDRAILFGEGSLRGLPPSALRIVEDAHVAPGLALIDAPDVDSIEHANRALSDQLAEAADLGIFVTTATRYADRVPWDVLLRLRDRGLPLLVVVNRMPPDPAEQRLVLADLAQLLAARGIQLERGAAELVPVAEGAVDPRTGGLDAGSVAPILERVDELRRDRAARRALAARSLAGALAGLPQLAEAVADDLDHQAIDSDALRRAVNVAFDNSLREVREQLRRGTFLREETLRNWQAFVGADQVTRLFATGIGRVRGVLGQLLHGAPTAPIATVKESTTSDIITLARIHAADASRRAALAWSGNPLLAETVAGDAGLWAESEGFDGRLAARLDAWLASIAADVRETGAPKRALARGASTGLNAVAITVMLATFVHTGGLTGAEVGVAAASGFLNQKLLSALFGEAAMVEMIRRAGARLDEALEQTFDEERQRFIRLMPASGGLRDVAVGLRSVSAEVRAAANRLPPEPAGR